jgi:predicted nucleotidyltransferase
MLSPLPTVVRLHEGEIAELCRRYRIKELSIFGSASRGETGPDSDIDLLVEFLPGASISLLGHFAAERELSEILRCKVDLVSKRALREPLRKEIIPQARLLYEA